MGLSDRDILTELQARLKAVDDEREKIIAGIKAFGGEPYRGIGSRGAAATNHRGPSKNPNRPYEHWRDHALNVLKGNSGEWFTNEALAASITEIAEPVTSAAIRGVANRMYEEGLVNKRKGTNARGGGNPPSLWQYRPATVRPGEGVTS